MSKVFNDCIIQLLIEMKITSTTVMVNRISDSQKVNIQELRYMIETGYVSVGLHVEFSYDQHMEQVSDQHKNFCDLFRTVPSHPGIHKD